MTTPLSELVEQASRAYIQLEFLWKGGYPSNYHLDHLDRPGLVQERRHYASNRDAYQYDIVFIVASYFLNYDYATPAYGRANHVLKQGNAFLLKELVFPHDTEEGLLHRLTRPRHPEYYEYGSYDWTKAEPIDFQNNALLLLETAVLARQASSALRAALDEAAGTPAKETLGPFSVWREKEYVSLSHRPYGSSPETYTYHPLLCEGLDRVAEAFRQLGETALLLSARKALAEQTRAALDGGLAIRLHAQSDRGPAASLLTLLETLADGEEPQRATLLATQRAIAPVSWQGREAYGPMPGGIGVTQEQRRQLDALLGSAVALYAPEAQAKAPSPAR